MYLVKSPRLLKWFYSSLLWHKSRKDKIVYLTFDDGPIPNVTDYVLNTLRQFEAKATFFCIGDNIKKFPEVFARLEKEGHRIGNHTFNHLKGWKTDDESYLDNFLKCQELTQTRLFRPPYGRIKKSQIRKLKAESLKVKGETELKDQAPSALQIVMWDVLSGDFDTELSPEKCYQNVVKHVENGSIIVFHDSLKAFQRLEYALPKVLETLIKRGYTFGIL